MASKHLLVLKRTLKFLRNGSNCLISQVRTNSVWTQDGIIKAPYNDVEIPKCTLYDYVWQNLEKWPEKTMAVCAVTGRGYTYEQAFKLSNSFAANLRKKFNIRDGDAVAVMLPNLPDFPLIAMGILEAGGVMTTINPIYTSHELSRQLLNSDTKIVVTLPEIVDVVKNALNIAKLNIPIIVVKSNGQVTPEGTAVFNELCEDVHIDKSCLKEVRRTSEDICLLPYSSGTTGMPKGVEIVNRNIIASCQQINDPLIRVHNDTTATHQDAVMTVLPMYHIYATTVLMFHRMSQGCKIVTMSKFQPEQFLYGLNKHKINILFVAPPIVLVMTSHPAATPENFQYLELIVNGAAPLAITDIERFLRKVEHQIDFRQGYGLTETSPTVCITPKGSKKYSSVGPPIPRTELKIVNSDLESLGANETGELWVRGPQVMRGYRNNPQANAESLTADGWFRTGDLAFADNEGYVTIADRLKELIKVKGFQVPPAELEAVLRDHPAVDDAAVIGVPHPLNGEAPKAFVVLKKDQNVGAQEIKDFVTERVASYKKIYDITFIDNVPKSAAGKILRKELKEKYC